MGRPTNQARTRRRPGVETLEVRTLCAAAGVSVPRGAAYVPGQVVVQLRAGASAKTVGQALRRVGARMAGGVQALAVAKGQNALRVLDLRPGQSVLAAITRLQLSPAVARAEPNWLYTPAATSNDPQYTTGKLWGMYGDATSPSNKFGSQAGAAWAAGNTGSSTVYVGVIDEGILTTHEDLAANIWTNPFDPPDGLDNDGNGYADDTNGWNFDGNNRTVYDGTFDDHGTHVAGTIGAIGGNGRGVAGVAWNVKIIPAKFMGQYGGTLENAIRAIDYITDLKLRHGLNIVTTNNSWGGGGYSKLLLDAITRAAKANILFVTAAGNGGFDGVGDDNDRLPTYPANFDTTAGAGYDAVISVAALNASGARPAWSNFGATSVDLAAPGAGINSTLPGAGGASKYGAMNGTSMAAAHVTGAVALYASAYPRATAAQIKQALLASATRTASMVGKTVTGGRLNVGALMQTAPGSTVTGWSLDGRAFVASGGLDAVGILVAPVTVEFASVGIPQSRRAARV
jgi:thermitase